MNRPKSWQKELARLTGESVTAAITGAVRERLCRGSEATALPAAQEEVLVGLRMLLECLLHLLEISTLFLFGKLLKQ